MLTIRLQRIGRKHAPHFRVITSPKGEGGPKGKPIEYLGWIDPLTKKFELKKERILYWISKGAQPSATLHNMLIKTGVMQGKKTAKHHGAVKQQAAPATPPVAEQTASVQEPKAE